MLTASLSSIMRANYLCCVCTVRYVHVQVQEAQLWLYCMLEESEEEYDSEKKNASFLLACLK